MDNIDGRVQERIEKEAAVMSIEKSMSAEDTIPPGFVHDCLHQNERGDGILYAYLQKGRFVYNNNTGEMMEWAGHFWRVDKDEASMEAVEDVARVYEEEAYRLWEKTRDCSDHAEQKRLEGLQEGLRKRAAKLRSNRGVESCVKFAKRVRDPELKLTVDGNQFDARPWLLACKNGVIDLKTGKFRDGKQEEYISKACPIEFKDINEFSQKWEDALKQIYDGDEEITAYIQRLFGYGITGLTSEHIFPVFQGRGRNGKSMLIEVISHVLGPLVAPIRSEMLLAQPFGKNSSAPAPDIMALKGLRLAVASEADERSSFSSAQVKLLTGGDLLSARNPHDKYQTHFKSSHLLVLLTNDKPRAPDSDFAFWSRVHLVEFPLSFVPEPKESHERLAIKGLAEELKAEASAILAWLVRGCLLWQKEGLNPPDKIKNATIEYQKEEDLLAGFIEECCVVGEGKFASAADLYDAFKEWYQEKVGKRIPSQRFFGKRMKLKFHSSRSGGTYRYYGIGLKEDY